MAAPTVPKGVPPVPGVSPTPAATTPGMNLQFGVALCAWLGLHHLLTFLLPMSPLHVRGLSILLIIHRFDCWHES